MDLSLGHIRKIAVIDREISCLKLDIVTLQVTRIAKKNYTFFLKSRNVDQHRLYGVGFAIRNSQSAPLLGSSERIMSLCLQATKGNVNRVIVYVPSLFASPDVKDSFCEALADTVRIMNIDEPLFILGDFNACVGDQHIIIIIITIMVLFLKRFSMLNMLNCAEQCQ